MLAILRNTLSRMRGQIIGWGLGMAAYGGFIVVFYERSRGLQDQFTAMLENYPPEILAFFGGMDNLFTPQGYLHTYMFSILPLVLGIFAVFVGAGLLAGDEEKGTLDLVVCHPVSRTGLFFGRFLGLMLAQVLVLVIMWIGTVLPLGSTSLEVTPWDLALPTLSVLGMMVSFTGLGLLLSMLLPSSRIAAMTGSVILFASYIATMMGVMNPALEALHAFSPLTYYQGAQAIGAMEWGWFAAQVGIAILLGLVTWALFLRRDIRIAGEHGLNLPIPFLGKKRLAER
jgi:ABC-2 type transport system permease protein